MRINLSFMSLPSKRLWTIAETCARLSVSRWTLDRWRRSGKLRPVRLPTGGVRYREHDLARFEQGLKAVT